MHRSTVKIGIINYTLESARINHLFVIPKHSHDTSGLIVMRFLAYISDVLPYNSKVIIPLIVFIMIFCFYASKAFRITPYNWKSEFWIFPKIFAVFERILHIEPVHRSTVKIQIVHIIQYSWRINHHFRILRSFRHIFLKKELYVQNPLFSRLI